MKPSASPLLLHRASSMLPRLPRLLLAAVCAGCITAAHAGPSNLWTDNVLSESQAIPLTTPNQGLARARLLMADGDYARAARALNKVVKRWPSSEEAQRLLAQSLEKLGESDLAAHHARMAVALSAQSDAVTAH
jgi:Tfp pilus assembly protein PilF